MVKSRIFKYQPHSLPNETRTWRERRFNSDGSFKLHLDRFWAQSWVAGNTDMRVRPFDEPIVVVLCFNVQLRSVGELSQEKTLFICRLWKLGTDRQVWTWLNH